MFSRFLNSAPVAGGSLPISSNEVLRKRQPKPNRHTCSPERIRNQSGVVSTPKADRKRFGPAQHMTAETHATALLELLREADYPPGYMLNFAEIGKVYAEMCAQNRWRQRGWHSVGRAFDLLTTNGEKPYANFWGEDGRAQRLRVYPIPTETVVPSSVLKVA